jgi:hypothetical protein
MRVALQLGIDELTRGDGLFEHAPGLEPIVGALHFIERDRRGITDHKAALTQVLDLQRGDLRVSSAVVVDEIVEIGALRR